MIGSLWRELSEMLTYTPDQEARHNFEAMITGLDQQDRPLMVLKHLWGLSQRELSYVFGISQCVINARIQKAHAKIRRRLSVVDCFT